MFAYFSFTDSAPTDIYTLSLHDALPICPDSRGESKRSLTVSELSMMQRYSDKPDRSEEHTSELQSRGQLVCRLLLEKKNSIEHTRLRSNRTAHRPVIQNL